MLQFLGHIHTLMKIPTSTMTTRTFRPPARSVGCRRHRRFPIQQRGNACPPRPGRRTEPVEVSQPKWRTR